MVKGHLWQESLGHQVHAPDIQVHCEVPVVLRALQNAAVVHKPADGERCIVVGNKHEQRHGVGWIHVALAKG